MLTASQLCPALSVRRTAKKAKKWPEKRKQSQSLCLKNEKVSIYFNLGFSLKLKHVWGIEKKYWKYTQPYIRRPDQQVTRIYINIMFDTKGLIQMEKINLDADIFDDIQWVILTPSLQRWYWIIRFKHVLPKEIFCFRG